MGLLAAADWKGGAKSLGLGNFKSTDGLANTAAQQRGPLSSPGMPAMPGQSPLGMSLKAPPGNSLAASSGQKSYLG